MAYIAQVSKKHGVDPIIFYHPRLVLNRDGTAVVDSNEESLELFKTACEENGVIFVDMSQDFLCLYQEDYIVPHGFSNTHISMGHLNKHGHMAVANRLAAVINALSIEGREADE